MVLDLFFRTPAVNCFTFFWSNLTVKLSLKERLKIGSERLTERKKLASNSLHSFPTDKVWLGVALIIPVVIKLQNHFGIKSHRPTVSSYQNRLDLENGVATQARPIQQQAMPLRIVRTCNVLNTTTWVTAPKWSETAQGRFSIIYACSIPKVKVSKVKTARTPHQKTGEAGLLTTVSEAMVCSCLPIRYILMLHRHRNK